MMLRHLPFARSVLGAIPVAVLSACAPKLRPLEGAVVPVVALPAAAIPPGSHQVGFDWIWSDPDLTVRGDGVARISAPDSARLDFFVGGGMGGGRAVLIGDSLRAPGGAMVERLVPPVPLLWASLGRLSLPPANDTTVTASGDTVRADFGVPVSWRVTFRGDSLVRVERVANGRVVEWVDRRAGSIRYRNETSRRELRLTITGARSTPAFDESIWTP